MLLASCFLLLASCFLLLASCFFVYGRSRFARFIPSLRSSRDN
ncbi:hypothetical protein VH1709_contig00021-0004 [Vibrio harveyi]|nr:hypothetical protein VH1709_contig00021-0004 [Vibrio harveyi]